MSYSDDDPYAEIKITERRKVKKIKQIARETIEKRGLKLAKIDVREDRDIDGDVVLLLELVLANGKHTFEKGEDYFIIGEIGRKIRDSGERRYPLFSVETPDNIVIA